MASYIREGLRQAGIHSEMKDVMDVGTEILSEYDVILLGSPTYEPKMIQEDMLPFFEQMQNMRLEDKLGAAFGPGDTAWPDFCTAVEMLEERMRKCGVELICNNLMVDGIVEEAEAATLEWARSLGTSLLKRSNQT